MGIPFIKNFDDFASNTANPDPTRPIANAIGKLGQSFCNALSARPGTLTPTFLQSPLKWACQPYWDAQGFDGPTEEPQFTGGQCAIEYSVGVFILGELFSVGGQSPKLLTGPLGGFTRTIGNPSGGPFPTFPVTWTFSGNPQLNVITVSLNQAQIDASEIRVQPTGGAPDNCGNPPGDFVPGENPAPDPGPLPPGVGPTFNIRGQPIIVLPPTLEVAPNISVELPIGEINLGSGTGGGNAEPLLASEPIAGEGSGAGGGDNDFGDPPEGERWVGCCVDIISSPPGIGIIQSSIPQAIYPTTVGNVRLKFRGTQSPPAYDTPIANRQRSSCVWEPTRGLAPVGCFVNLLPGYAYTVTPYSVPLEQ